MTVQQPAPTGYSRLQLLIILLTPVLVVLGSSALYFSGWLIPTERSNQGYLLTPVLSVTDFGLPEIEITQDRQWQLLQWSPSCDEGCTQQLYLQRQLNVALGKNQDRVSRVLLTSDVSDSVNQEYPLLKTETGATLSATVLDRIPAEHLANHPVFVVDPFGNIMLYFTEQTFQQRLKDLKRLLKNSTIG